MPNCPSGCLVSFQLPTQILTFSLARPVAEVQGFAAGVPASYGDWSQADTDRVAAKLQAFYDALPVAEQWVVAELLERAAEAIVA